MVNTNSLTQLVNPAGDTGFAINTSWSGFFGGYVGTSAEGADIKEKAVTACTLLNFGVRISANTDSVSMTFLSRKNGGNGNQTMTAGANSPGWFQDTTHTDSVVSGDLFNAQRGSGNNVTVTMYEITTQNTSPLAIYGIRGNGLALSLSTTAIYIPIIGRLNSVTAVNGEQFAQQTLRAAGTLQNLCVQVGSVPSAGNTCTVKARKSGVDQNETITFDSTATTSSIITDSTHTDTVASGDLWDTSGISTAATGSIRWITYEFLGTISAHDVASFTTNTPNGGTALAASTTYFGGWGGNFTGATTENTCQCSSPYAITATRLRAYFVNNSTNGFTVNGRQNTANSNLTISVANGTTGDVEDATHSDSYASGDTGNFGITTGATVTNLHIRDLRILLDDGSNSGNTNYTDSVTETASATDSPTATQGQSGSVTETASPTDSPSATQVQLGSASESASATDNPSAAKGQGASASESAAAITTQDAVIVAITAKNVTICFMG